MAWLRELEGLGMLGFRDEGLGCSELRVESSFCRRALFTGVDPNGFTTRVLL